MTADPEAVLLAFSVEPKHDRATLERYINDYPDLAEELVDLSHELRVQAEVGPGDGTPEQDAAFEAAWQEFASCGPDDAFGPYTGQAFAKLAERLAVPRSFLAAFRDRLVQPATIPLRFVERLAAELATNPGRLMRFLELPPAAPHGLAFKADRKPSTPHQVAFDYLVANTTFTAVQIAAIHADMGSDGRR